MIQLDTRAFTEFCSQMTIPSRDAGPILMTQLMGTQEYWLNEVAAGLERGVHEFVTLKGGRQVGGTTGADAMTLWWMPSNDGTQGALVSDDDENRDWRRDVLTSMNDSLPKRLRYPFRVYNRTIAAWTNGSRLAFLSAGHRQGSNLGRSRGLSYLHADEVGSWPDPLAISALRASLSEINPQRLYLWNSTARGIDTPFHDLWKVAQTAVSQRAIFLAWWRHGGYSVPDEDERFARYGRANLSADERIMLNVVRQRYDVVLTRNQMAWYRWKLAEGMNGDEVMMAQEFASLPEEAFQAFGEKFIGPSLIRRLRLGLDVAPKAAGYKYQFHETLDETAEKGILPADPTTDLLKGTLRVWEEPAHEGVYLVAGHPQYASSDTASLYVAEVFRIWPDRMAQVAEYVADAGHMYQFAWTLLHLCGAYRTFLPTYFMLEIGASGSRVLEEIQLIERYGFGLTSRAHGKIQDFLGSVRHYYYMRPDQTGRRTAPISWKTHGNNRPLLLHGLRDTVERGKMEVRSELLIDAFAALRQGDATSADAIVGSGKGGDSVAVCAALAVECWSKSAIPDLAGFIPRAVADPRDPKTAGERLVSTYMQGLLAERR